MNEIERIRKKWDKSGLLEGLSNDMKERMAALIEQQAKALYSDVPIFKRDFGFSRRTFKWNIISDLVAVQPMSVASGLLFYMDYKYESKPCAEITLATDEDFYVPMRKPAPAVIADPNMYPHKCPRCAAPAYIGLMKVDCSRKSCA